MHPLSRTSTVRALGWGGLVALVLASLASTGCYTLAQNLGEAVTLAVAVVGLVAVVVCLVVAVALARAERPRLGFAFAGTALILFGWAVFALVRTAQTGIPLDAAEHRLALVPLALLPIPIAAMRSRARVAALGLVVAIGCAYLVLLVLVRPGSRLPDGNAIDVAVGDHGLCALFEDGGVACVGDNTVGEMGVGDGHSTRPWALSLSLPPVDAIDAAGSDFCAHSTAGETYCWGEHHGLTPTRVAVAPSFTPAPIVDETNAVCRIDAAGRVFCGDRAIALSRPAAHLRGAGGLVCIAESERRGVLCWGTVSYVRLHGTAEQRQPADLVGMFGPRWVWPTPSPIDWP